MSEKVIKLGHGSGGSLSRRLIESHILRFFDSPLLAPLGDSALLDMEGVGLAFTTDSYVVDPIFFPGGDIGKLAVCGTVNDLAVCGALPRFISCALIIEEGFPENHLSAILGSMHQTAKEAEVEVVTGDTKVVPRGKADRIFVNTAGLGVLAREDAAPARMAPGDKVIVSGPLGDHEAAVLVSREGLNLDSSVVSDCAPLTQLAQAVFKVAGGVSFMRDVTRGGLATILNEMLVSDAPGILLREPDIPVRDEVRAICELLGLDPLYMACEGRLVAVVDAASAQDAVAALRGTPGGEQSCIIGVVSEDYTGQLVLETSFATRRLLQMLSGTQLPRIC